MLLPALAAAKRKAQKINCVNNLKQVGLAFRIWSGDNGDKYPMAVSKAQGGANEYVDVSATSGTGSATAGLNPIMPFMVMSNELSTPKVCYCPSDSYHSTAPTNFNYNGFAGVSANTAGAQDQLGQCSYFVNGSGSDVDPQMVIDGDENIGTTGATVNGPASYMFGAAAGTSATSAQLLSGAAWNGAAYWSWTANEMHQKTGNTGMGDGSVQSVSITGLHTELMNSTNSTSIQYFNFPK
jgi:hypothetical protein